jgi:hypothetical protein
VKPPPKTPNRNQPDLFSSEGDVLKAEGMDLAKVAAAEWWQQAWTAVETLASSGAPFGSEDVIRMVGLPRVTRGINRNNALGALMSQAARAGIIEKVGYVTARRPSSHSSLRILWKGISSDD